MHDDNQIKFDPTKVSPPTRGRRHQPIKFDDKLIDAIIRCWRDQGQQEFTARDLCDELLKQGATFPTVVTAKQICIQLSRRLKVLHYQHAPGVGAQVFIVPPGATSQDAPTVKGEAKTSPLLGVGNETKTTASAQSGKKD